MCNANIAMGVQAGGGVFSAISEYQAGAEDSRYYKYLAKTTDKNAELVEKKGKADVSEVQDVASLESKQIRQEGKDIEATQIVSQASSGIIGGVTAQDITVDTFNKVKMDELMIRYNANKRSKEILDKANYDAMNLRQKADQLRATGKNAKRTGLLQAGKGLLTTASQVAQTWYLADKYKTKKDKP